MSVEKQTILSNSLRIEFNGRKRREKLSDEGRFRSAIRGENTRRQTKVKGEFVMMLRVDQMDGKKSLLSTPLIAGGEQRSAGLSDRDAPLGDRPGSERRRLLPPSALLVLRRLALGSSVSGVHRERETRSPISGVSRQ